MTDRLLTGANTFLEWRPSSGRGAKFEFNRSSSHLTATPTICLGRPKALQLTDSPGPST